MLFNGEKEGILPSQYIEELINMDNGDDIIIG